MTFSIEELRMLAELERKMDSGEQPFVRVDETQVRLAVADWIMERIGLESGQTISGELAAEICRMNIADCTRKLDELAAKEADK